MSILFTACDATYWTGWLLFDSATFRLYNKQILNIVIIAYYTRDKLSMNIYTIFFNPIFYTKISTQELSIISKFAKDTAQLTLKASFLVALKLYRINNTTSGYANLLPAAKDYDDIFSIVLMQQNFTISSSAYNLITLIMQLKHYGVISQYGLLGSSSI